MVSIVVIVYSYNEINNNLSFALTIMLLDSVQLFYRRTCWTLILNISVWLLDHFVQKLLKVLVFIDEIKIHYTETSFLP